MTVQRKAFGGAVTFHVRPRTLNNLVLQDLMMAAVPEAATFKAQSQAAIIFENLGTFLAQTETITFAPETVPPDVQGLQTFWTLVQADSSDYAALWLAFRQQVSIEAHNEWLEAVNDAIPEAYRAPDFVQPDADTTDPN